MKGNSNTPETRDFVARSNVTFAFDTNRMIPRDLHMNELVQDYNVKIVSCKWRDGGDIKPILLRFLPLYAENFAHWSKYGHRYAAIKISEIVKNENTKVSNRVRSLEPYPSEDIKVLEGLGIRE